jgi:hypothetical protein
MRNIQYFFSRLTLGTTSKPSQHITIHATSSLSAIPKRWLQPRDYRAMSLVNCLRLAPRKRAQTSNRLVVNVNLKNPTRLLRANWQIISKLRGVRTSGLALGLTSYLLLWRARLKIFGAALAKSIACNNTKPCSYVTYAFAWSFDRLDRSIPRCITEGAL